MRRLVIIGLLILCCQLAFSQLKKASATKATSKEAATRVTTWRLWYESPSGSIWENALPVGNGRLGAMVYGNVEKEILQLNEHTVWSGSPNRNDNPLALDSLATLRQLIFEGKQKDAERIANRVIITKKSHGQKFEP